MLGAQQVDFAQVLQLLRDTHAAVTSERDALAQENARLRNDLSLAERRIDELRFVVKQREEQWDAMVTASSDENRVLQAKYDHLCAQAADLQRFKESVTSTIMMSSTASAPGAAHPVGASTPAALGSSQLHTAASSSSFRHRAGSGDALSAGGATARDPFAAVSTPVMPGTASRQAPLAHAGLGRSTPGAVPGSSAAAAEPAGSSLLQQVLQSQPPAQQNSWGRPSDAAGGAGVHSPLRALSERLRSGAWEGGAAGEPLVARSGSEAFAASASSALSPSRASGAATDSLAAALSTPVASGGARGASSSSTSSFSSSSLAWDAATVRKLSATAGATQPTPGAVERPPRHGNTGVTMATPGLANATPSQQGSRSAAAGDAVDAASFYRQVKEVLDPGGFQAFAAEIRALNEGRQSSTETLRNVQAIFGENRPFLFSQMERLVRQAEAEAAGGV